MEIAQHCQIIMTTDAMNERQNVMFIKIRQSENRENIKVIKHIKAKQLNTNSLLFYLIIIFIQRSNNERLFVQISVIIRQPKKITTQMQITCTCTIRREQIVKGMLYHGEHEHV